MEKKYFLAIVPPEPLYGELVALKEKIGTAYEARAALRSPPHVTLHMPFLWNETKEDKLAAALRSFTREQRSLTVALNGFNCFAPRVVYVAVEENEPLQELQRKLFKHCKLHLNIFNANYRDKPFHPHITLAFRDLKKEKFESLWNELATKPFDANFVTNSITLLKHDGRQWIQYSSFLLNDD